MSIKFIFFSRKNPLHILVALDNDDDKGGQAEGELFWDDGDSIGIVVFCLLCWIQKRHNFVCVSGDNSDNYFF